MFERLPTIDLADELIDRAFRRSKKIKMMDRDPTYRMKKTIIARTESFVTTIASPLETYVKKFPSIDNLHPFYRELIDIKIDSNKLKKALGAVDWARKTCQQIQTSQAKSLKKSKNIDFLKQKQYEIQGRISSVVKQVNAELLVLAEAQKILKAFPAIQDIPTVVIAGYPNVGKSSLLRRLSSAKPAVAQYPFTTKEIYVGHMQQTNHFVTKPFQLIDTPGLLDRPFEQRNDIEKQAIAALAHLADIIVFVLDPSETCGYSVTDQHQLLDQMHHLFPKASIIVVENKGDIAKSSSKNLIISCENGQGIDVLIEKLFLQYPSQEQLDEKKRMFS